VQRGPAVCLNCVSYDHAAAHQCRDRRAEPVEESMWGTSASILFSVRGSGRRRRKKNTRRRRGAGSVEEIVRGLTAGLPTRCSTNEKLKPAQARHIVERDNELCSIASPSFLALPFLSSLWFLFSGNDPERGGVRGVFLKPSFQGAEQLSQPGVERRIMRRTARRKEKSRAMSARASGSPLGSRPCQSIRGASRMLKPLPFQGVEQVDIGRRGRR